MTAKTKTIELFDFAELIGGYIDFRGSFNSANYYVNANIFIGCTHARLNKHQSCYGRSDKADLEEALKNLAATISEKEIWFESERYRVPKLKHTKGYRG